MLECRTGACISVAGDDSHPDLLQLFGTLQFEANSSSKAFVSWSAGWDIVWGHCWTLCVCHSLSAAERLLEQMVLRGSFVCCHCWKLALRCHSRTELLWLCLAGGGLINPSVPGGWSMSYHQFMQSVGAFQVMINRLS